MTFNELRETLESLKNHTVQEVMAVVRQNCFIQTVEASEEGVGRRLDRPMFGGWNDEIFYAEKRMHMTRNEPHYFVTDEMSVLGATSSGDSFVLTLNLEEFIPEESREKFYDKVFDIVFGEGEEAPILPDPRFMDLGVEIRVKGFELRKEYVQPVELREAFLCGMMTSEEFTKH